MLASRKHGPTRHDNNRGFNSVNSPAQPCVLFITACVCMIRRFLLLATCALSIANCSENFRENKNALTAVTAAVQNGGCCGNLRCLLLFNDFKLKLCGVSGSGTVNHPTPYGSCHIITRRVRRLRLSSYPCTPSLLQSWDGVKICLRMNARAFDTIGR